MHVRSLEACVQGAGGSVRSQDETPCGDTQPGPALSWVLEPPGVERGPTPLRARVLLWEKLPDSMGGEPRAARGRDQSLE